MTARHATLAAALLALACEDVDKLPDDYEDLCENGAVPWVKHVNGAPAYDSMEVRDGHDSAAGVKTIDKTGTPCATATDKTACESAYASVDLAANGNVAFVATRGNDVIVKNVSELGANVLGPIDNPYEAAVLAVTERERAPLTCANGQLVGAKRSAENFQIAVINVDACTGRKTRVIVAVDENGATREVQRDEISAGEIKVCDK